MNVTADRQAAEPRLGALFLVFVAALGPMITVPAIRRLVMDVHGGSPALVQLFVAVGMIGSAVGAPLVAARADAGANRFRVMMILAVVDALVGFACASPIPTVWLFVLRPLHGAASMGMLALLLARFRSNRRLVSYGGAAMVVALAAGPAIGGILAKASPLLPFRAAALCACLLALCSVRGAVSSPSGPRPIPRTRPRFFEAARASWTPLLVVASQRFAIGGLVASFAVQARVVRGLDDAHIGRCFSILLVVFAVGLVVIGKLKDARSMTRLAPVGSILFAGGLAVLGFGPSTLVSTALGLAGIGAALVYAPCLAAVSSHAGQDARATSMALLHGAGALGMIAGPLVAAALDLALRSSTIGVRCGAFMVVGGVVHATVTCMSSSRLEAMTH